MGMATDGLSYWQAETEGIELLDTTIGDLLDRRADELPTQEAVVYSCYPEFGDALNLRWTYPRDAQRAEESWSTRLVGPCEHPGTLRGPSTSQEIRGSRTLPAGR